MRAAKTGLLLLAIAGGCSFDTEAPAPYLAPPNKEGVCGTTETLLPNLLGFVREGKMEPLREVLERRLLPSQSNPQPDPSLRTLLGALVNLATGFGLDRTATTVELAAHSEAILGLKPYVVVVFQFINGDIDGRPHWESSEAIATLIDRCDAENLLTAVELVLRLRSPAHENRLWLSVLGNEAKELIQDPQLEPFLNSFERNAQTGKPAIIALIDQILFFIDDDDFTVSRVRTLLESAVYPVVSEAMRLRIEKFVDLLEIATAPQAGIFVPLQGAIRCLNQQDEARHELISFLYDLIVTDQVALADILETVESLVDDEESEKLTLFVADLVHVLRVEPDTRAPLLDLLVVLLSRPEVVRVTPVLIDLVEEDVLAELISAVAKLLGGCGRDPS